MKSDAIRMMASDFLLEFFVEWVYDSEYKDVGNQRRFLLL